MFALMPLCIHIRPRLDGGGAAAAAPADDGTVEEGLFKMKPTKAEKKAAAAVSNRVAVLRACSRFQPRYDCWAAASMRIPAATVIQ